MKKKKIVICASVSFENEIKIWKTKLENNGFEVIKYPIKIKGDFLNNYKKEFSEHYNIISDTEILLVLNLDKKGIPGYIGAGVFAEIAFALGLNKAFNKNIDVRYLNPFPKDKFSYSDELNLWKDLGWIKLFKKIN